jgi:hypothetical protein
MFQSFIIPVLQNLCFILTPVYFLSLLVQNTLLLISVKKRKVITGFFFQKKELITGNLMLIKGLEEQVRALHCLKELKVNIIAATQNPDGCSCCHYCLYVCLSNGQR